LDKLELLEILNSWNYWNRDLPTTHKREFYDKKISSFLRYDEVVVIKGVRRSGKSSLIQNQIRDLVNNGTPKNEILFINLEDPRLTNRLSLELLENIKNLYLEQLSPKNRPYIFLDEIQNIPNWERWVNKEYEQKTSKIIVTGSNSSMLSSEIASTLSGRYLSIVVYPLSFSEYLEFRAITVGSLLDLAHNKIAVNREFENYLKYGGFPKVLEYKDEDRKDLLQSYKETILLKDIVARYRLKSYQTLDEIASFLLANSGTLQSYSNIKNSFKTSFDVAKNYIEYLKNSYILHDIAKFDYSIKKQNANDKKYYTIDLGLSNILRVPNLTQRGANIETVVFLELLRRGFSIYYYKSVNNQEVDFVIAKEGAISALIQVSSTLENEKTLKRELAPFDTTIKDLGLENIEKIVITEDKSQNIDDVKVINILEWLTLSNQKA